MSFRDLDIKIRYRSNEHDFPRDFFIPVLKETVVYKRSVGYFSTSSLIDLSTGLFAMAEHGGKVQLICSPKLSSEDIQAIDLGYKTREEVIIGALEVSLTSPLNFFEEERLNLIANMVASGMLEMRLAFMSTDTGINIYHEKIAIYIDSDGNRISFTGSMNESSNGFDENFESIYTFCSWKDQSQIDAVAEAERDFDNNWIDNTKKLKVVPFPDIIIDKLLNFRKSTVDYTTDEREYGYRSYIKKNAKFHMPDYVKMRGYQDTANDQWFKQHCKGIYSMCTGAGKTFTALAAMVRLAEQLNDKLAVFIVCPYIHLVSQWEEDVIEWAPIPIIAHSKSTTPRWEDRLKQACRRFRKEGAPFVCITTNDTFSGPKVQPYVTKFTEDDNILFIVDEAHNFGSETLSSIMPEQFKYRIALSATIERHMDRAGTARLFRFFGDEVINYGLEDAIRDKALVPYDYFPIPVYLQNDELNTYQQLTRELKKYLIQKNGKLRVSEAGKFIVYQRTRLLAGARGKVALLMELMGDYRDKKNILVYCGATMAEDEDSGEESRQIDLVTQKLRSEYGMSVQRFTAEEDLKERQNIKEYFQDGLYQVITAIKCLDEGVNIPGIQTAFILSSSRNPKEFIQRRGRLLRRSEGKNKAVIYDFVTLPRDLDDVLPTNYNEDKSIILGELARINEFGKLASNREKAAELMTHIMDSYGVYIDIEEETKKAEDYYGDE